MMMEDRCVVCGTVIPEGRQVCHECEESIMIKEVINTYRATSVKTIYGELDRNINVGDVVRHFKGGLYRVVAFAQHTETGEDMVVYQALMPVKYGVHDTFVRPREMFMSEVDRQKYPDATQYYRMEKVYISVL